MADYWLERDRPYSEEQDLKRNLPNSLCFSLVAAFFPEIFTAVIYIYIHFYFTFVTV